MEVGVYKCMYILRMFENMRDYMANGRRYNRIYVDGRYQSANVHDHVYTHSVNLVCVPYLPVL